MDALFWCDGTTDIIGSSGINGHGVRSILPGNFVNVQAVFAHKPSGILFYTDPGISSPLTPSRIRRMDFNGGSSGIVVQVGTGSPENLMFGIVADTKRDNLYFTNFTTRRIQRCGLNGSGMVTLLEFSSPSTPWGLDIDLINNKLFWSDTTNGWIGRSNIDGTQSGVFINTGTGVRGIAVDHTDEKIYWADFTGNLIRRANLSDGSNIENVLSSGTHDVRLPFDVGIHNISRKLYWNDQRVSGNPVGVVKYKHLSDNNIVAIASGFSSLSSLSIVQNQIAESNNQINLSISSNDDHENSMTLFMIDGIFAETDDIILHTTGIDTDDNTLDIFIDGVFGIINDSPLHIYGNDFSSGIVPLTMVYPSFTINGFNLFIKSPEPVDGNADLSLVGKEYDDNSLDVNIFGMIQIDQNLNLFINAPETISRGMNLFIGRIPSGVMDFSWSIENLLKTGTHNPQLIGNLDYVGVQNDVGIRVFELKFGIPTEIPMSNSGCYPIGNTGRWGFSTEYLPITDYEKPQYHYIMVAPNDNEFQGHFFMSSKQRFPKKDGTFTKKIKET